MSVKRYRMFLAIRDTEKTELVLADDYEGLEKLCVDFIRAIGEALIDKRKALIRHECPDWDFMEIDGNDAEMTGCTCQWKDHEKQRIANEAHEYWSKELDEQNEMTALQREGKST